MCTVVFIPDNKEIYFASLRDESIARPLAKAPEQYAGNEMNFVAPLDALAGGTWLGINDAGIVIILLNGGFEKHIVKQQYAKSRGLIVKDLLVSHTPVNKWLSMSLDEIEPFTLVIGNHGSLVELIWDGEHKSLKELDHTVAHIWSSATLYDKTARKHRENLFTKWIQDKPLINPNTLLSFFVSEADFENGFIINRNEQIKTQNYTFISIEHGKMGSLYYQDFVANNLTCRQIPFVPSQTNHL